MSVRTLPAALLLVGLTAAPAWVVPALADPPPRALEVLRVEIDRVDQNLLRLLNERAAITGEVAKAKAGSNAPVFRPGRQAALIRKLAAQPGLQSDDTLAHVWTAVIAGSILQQKADFTVAVVEDAHGAITPLAQGYFGAQMPRLALPTADAALAALAEHRADVAVLSLDGPWWQRLPEGMRVIAAVPFLRAEKAGPQAVVVARQEIDPSGDDITVARLPPDEEPANGTLLASQAERKLWAFAKGVALPSSAEPIGIYAKPLAPPDAEDKTSARK
ncbi:chorismate mutase [Xanthobacteraceae bacterium A53D]